MRRLSLAALVLASSLAVDAASAAPFFPSDPGTVWHYVSDSGRYDDLVAGQLLDVPIGSSVYSCRAFTFAPGSVHEGLTELVAFADDGSFRLAGLVNGSGAGVHFNPPIMMLLPRDYPAEAYIFQCQSIASPSGDATAFTYSVIVEQSTFTVPAGTFTGFSGGMRALFGYGDGYETGDVWADGMGCLQYQDVETFRLVGVDQPTPTQVTSWGSIKSRYR